MHSMVHHTKPDGKPYPREECPMYAALNDGAVHHIVDEVLWRKDGTSFPVEYHSTPMRNEEGSLIGAVVTFRDITEKKKAEERFRLVVEAAPSGMIMINNTGEIVLVNHRIETMFGYARHELLGTTIETLVPERFRLQHLEHRTKFFANSEPRSFGSTRNIIGLRKNHSTFPIELALNPLVTTDGNFVLASVIDITERKAAERRIAVEHNVARILTEQSSLDEAAFSILRAICTNLEWEVGAFWKPSSMTPELKCLAIFEGDPGHSSDIYSRNEQRTLRPGNGSSRTGLEERRAQLDSRCRHG